ncbi:YggU family protein [Candidatus Woesearchaeota archaeon]|nr:YggU family protein [Candidatus Woesearchaeota archaeon]
MEIKGEKFKVIVKTNSSKNEVVCYDEARKAYRINLKAKPIEGEANKELIKFLSREIKRKVRIVSGFRNKEKVIELF